MIKNKISKERFAKEIDINLSYYQDIIREAKGMDENDNETKPCSINIASNHIDTLLRIKNGCVPNPDLFFNFANLQGIKPLREKHIDIISNDLKKPSANGNASVNAVKKAMTMKSILAIQGPPGAGKTTTIIEMIAQIKKEKPKAKILITSSTHVAVDNVVERILRSDPKNVEFNGRTDEYTGLRLFDDLFRVRQKKALDGSNRLRKYDIPDYFSNCVKDLPEKYKNIISEFDATNDKSDDAYNKNELLNYFRSDLILSKGIICVTVNSLNGCHFPFGTTFDYVIVDEAAKMCFAEIMFAAKFAKKLILIGDPKQLPPTVSCNFLNDDLNKKYDDLINNQPFIEYLFEELREHNPDCFEFLDIQYRMRPEIGSFISNAFYSGNVKNGRKNGDANSKFNYPPLVFVDYDANECKCIVDKKPLTNKKEIEIIENIISDDKFLADLRKRAGVSECNNPDDIMKYVSIITPYKDQKLELIKAGLNIPKYNIDTVDAFQGKENDTIIFSCVRNHGKPTEFFKKNNRLNVAISRAKNQVWIIGSKKYLQQIPSLNEYIKLCENDKNKPNTIAFCKKRKR